MSVRLERDDDGVAVLTFADPPVNLYSLQMHDAFDSALDDVEADLPRAFLVRAEGRIVSGGVDVSQFRGATSAAGTMALYDRMLELPERIAASPCPLSSPPTRSPSRGRSRWPSPATSSSPRRRRSSDSSNGSSA